MQVFRGQGFGTLPDIIDAWDGIVKKIMTTQKEDLAWPHVVSTFNGHP